MIKLISANPEQYQSNGDKMLQFEKLLLGQEGKLFSGTLYQNAVAFEFDFPGVVEVRGNDAFKKEFMINLQNLQIILEEGQRDNLKSFFDRHNFLMFVFREAQLH